MKKVIIYIIVQFLITDSYSQLDSKQPFTADSIPAFQVFLDSAMINSPLIKMYETQIVQNQNELFLLKYSWMKEIYLSVDSKYGKYGNLQPGDQNTLGYGAGAVIKIPLTAFVGNSQRKKIAEVELEESIFQKEVIISEFKNSLIKQFNETLYKKTVITIRVEALQTALLNYQLAEKEFKGGVIQIDQYSRISEIYFLQLQLMEEAKMELKISLAVLLEMSGIKSSKL